MGSRFGVLCVLDREELKGYSCVQAAGLDEARRYGQGVIGQSN